MTHLALPLVFGAATLGNLTEAISDEQAYALLEAAWACGIRSFDTAPHYGLGLSERRLGAYLQTKPRQDFTISTKVGRLLRPNPTPTERDDNLFEVPGDVVRVWDFSPQGIAASLAESLERTGLSRIDTLYLHDPDKAPGITLDAAFEALADLRERHQIATIGVGSMSADLLARAAEHPLAEQLMVAGRHTLMDHSASETVLPVCRARGVRVAATAIFNSGLLATPEPGRSFDYAEAPQDVVNFAIEIAAICRNHGTDLPTAALHYVVRERAVTSIVFGARTPEQIEQNVARAATPPPADLWAELASEALIPAAYR